MRRAHAAIALLALPLAACAAHGVRYSRIKALRVTRVWVSPLRIGGMPAPPDRDTVVRVQSRRCPLALGDGDAILEAFDRGQRLGPQREEDEQPHAIANVAPSMLITFVRKDGPPMTAAVTTYTRFRQVIFNAIKIELSAPDYQRVRTILEKRDCMPSSDLEAS